MSAFGSVSSIELRRIWDGVHARVVRGDRTTLGVVELDPNAVVPEHAHEQEQLGICLEGSLEFRVADERRALGPGDTWAIRSNVPHEVRVGPAGAVVVDVFAPGRHEWHEAPPAAARDPRWP